METISLLYLNNHFFGSINLEINTNKLYVYSVNFDLIQYFIKNESIMDTIYDIINQIEHKQFNIDDYKIESLSQKYIDIYNNWFKIEDRTNDYIKIYVNYNIINYNA